MKAAQATADKYTAYNKLQHQKEAEEIQTETLPVRSENSLQDDESLEMLVVSLKNEIEALNSFSEEMIEQMKIKDKMLAESKEKYDDLKRKYDMLTNPKGKENVNYFQESVEGANQSKDFSAIPQTTRAKSKKCDNLPITYKEHIKNKGNLQQKGHSRCISIANKIKNNPYTPAENQSLACKRQHRTTKSISFAIAAHTARRLNQDTLNSIYQTALSGAKTSRGSPHLKRRLKMEECIDNINPCNADESFETGEGNGPAIDKKDYSISSIEEELLKQISKNARTDGTKNEDDSEIYEDYNQQMKDFMKKCPYIDQLKKTSEKYKAIIMMLQALAVYTY